MIQNTIEHNYCIKSLLCIILLLCGSVYSMDDPIQESLVKQSLFFLIPADVINNHLKQKVRYQGIGRIKQVSKACNANWKVDNICVTPQGGCASKCSVPACRRLAQKFDACSKALGYYARQDNREMFSHFWCHDHEDRNNLVIKMMNVEKPQWIDRMNFYRGNCFNEADKIILCSEYLARAMVKKDHEAVKMLVLLNKKYDVSRGVNYHTSLLKCACKYGDIDILLRVLGGVDHINDTDISGKAAIHYAWKKTVLFSELMGCGADINKTDANGRTVLFFAIEWGDVNILRTILSYKPHVNIVDKSGCMVAHHAMMKYKDDLSYKIEILDLLLGAGIDVNHKRSISAETFLDYTWNISPQVRRRAVKDLLKKHGIKRKRTWF